MDPLDGVMLIGYGVPFSFALIDTYTKVRYWLQYGSIILLINLLAACWGFENVIGDRPGATKKAAVNGMEDQTRAV